MSEIIFVPKDQPVYCKRCGSGPLLQYFYYGVGGPFCVLCFTTRTPFELGCSQPGSGGDCSA